VSATDDTFSIVDFNSSTSPLVAASPFDRDY
jgi:hypothetical protein